MTAGVKPVGAATAALFGVVVMGGCSNGRADHRPPPSQAFAAGKGAAACWAVPVKSLTGWLFGTIPGSLPMAGATVVTSSAAKRLRGLGYAIRRSDDGNVTEFSTRDTDRDRALSDHAPTRRSEIRLPILFEAGIVYRGAYTLSLRGWKRRQVVLGQAHAPAPIDGSPVWAFRRIANGDAAVFARSVFAHDRGKAIWSAPIDWSVSHDIVFEVRYGRTRGALNLWLDGKPIVRGYRWPNALVDRGSAGIYWKHGLYAGDGQGSSQMWARYANVVFHSRTWDPRARISRPLTCRWPALRGLG